MKVFERVNGRWSITGNPVWVDVVTVRRGVERVETLLTNGSTVGVVYRDNYLTILTGKGGRTERVSEGTVFRFFVDGVLAAEVDEDWAKEFDVIPA